MTRSPRPTHRFDVPDRRAAAADAVIVRSPTHVTRGQLLSAAANAAVQSRWSRYTSDMPHSVGSVAATRRAASRASARSAVARGAQFGVDDRVQQQDFAIRIRGAQRRFEVRQAQRLAELHFFLAAAAPQHQRDVRRTHPYRCHAAAHRIPPRKLRAFRRMVGRIAVSGAYVNRGQVGAARGVAGVHLARC